MFNAGSWIGIFVRGVRAKVLRARAYSLSVSRLPSPDSRCLPLVVLAALALTACGFHLRGEAHISPALTPLRVQFADPNSPLKRDLEAALERAGVALAGATQTDAALLRLPLMQVATEPLTVGRTARVQEYRVRYKVELEVSDAAGKVLLTRTPVELTRDYSFDETQALGAQVEEDLLKKELGREMVQQILRRLERL
jgi:LPS-assembly lipoprotein